MRYYHSGIAPNSNSDPLQKTPGVTVNTAQQPLGDIDALLCFSHLRWDFVYQRPQHLISRASSHWPVLFWEEPVWDDNDWLEVRPISAQLQVLIPHLKHGTDEAQATSRQRQWLHQFLDQQAITNYITWYYTPMALTFTNELKPCLTIFDCMDELSAFRGAPPQLRQQEAQLMQQADLMFTGGFSLFEAKKTRHPSVHLFPSSIEYEFFYQARSRLLDPVDQRHLPGPRIGYCGVIDERFDTELLRELALRRPDWQFVLIGPIVKINPQLLPQGPNLHYLGMKSYKELPAYFSHWQAALLPFARNESTRFISPTKTPEYLAAGLPVIATPIEDVVHTYGKWNMVFIANTMVAFEDAIETALQKRNALDWSGIDRWLTQHSWQQTWQLMHSLIQNKLKVVATQSVSDSASLV